jgi:hypothetical protein
LEPGALQVGRPEKEPLQPGLQEPWRLDPLVQDQEQERPPLCSAASSALLEQAVSGEQVRLYGLAR